jgi:hypothetical protein
LRQLEANKVNADEKTLQDIDAYLVGFPPASINPKILELAEQIMKHADDLVKRYQAPPTPPPPPPPPPAPSGPMASMDAADAFWHEVA